MKRITINDNIMSYFDSETKFRTEIDITKPENEDLLTNVNGVLSTIEAESSEKIKKEKKREVEKLLREYEKLRKIIEKLGGFEEEEIDETGLDETGNDKKDKDKDKDETGVTG